MKIRSIGIDLSKTTLAYWGYHHQMIDPANHGRVAYSGFAHVRNGSIALDWGGFPPFQRRASTSRLRPGAHGFN